MNGVDAVRAVQQLTTELTNGAAPAYLAERMKQLRLAIFDRLDGDRRTIAVSMV
jgi:hypothetical protein